MGVGAQSSPGAGVTSPPFGPLLVADTAVPETTVPTTAVPATAVLTMGALVAVAAGARVDSAGVAKLAGAGLHDASPRAITRINPGKRFMRTPCRRALLAAAGFKLLRPWSVGKVAGARPRN
jgi:hypothetical protein